MRVVPTRNSSCCRPLGLKLVRLRCVLSRASSRRLSPAVASPARRKEQESRNQSTTVKPKVGELYTCSTERRNRHLIFTCARGKRVRRAKTIGRQAQHVISYSPRAFPAGRLRKGTGSATTNGARNLFLSANSPPIISADEAARVAYGPTAAAAASYELRRRR